MKKILVFGLLSSIEFQKAKCYAQDLFKKKINEFDLPIVNGMMEFHWSEWIMEKKKELKGSAWNFQNSCMVFLDNQLIGNSDDFLEWAQKNYQFEDFRNEDLYKTLSKEEYGNYFQNSKNDFVFFDLIQEDQKLGRLLIELFSNRLPKTCKNFQLLCTGEQGRTEDGSKYFYYKNTIIHRIVPNGWIQGGDLGRGSGNESESIYGGFFEDESFQISHNTRGILGMANHGRHTNGSQFYITLLPALWMDRKYVAFGKVIEGSETLSKLENLKTINERPEKECRICDCGIFVNDF